MRTYIRANAPGATYFFTLAFQERGTHWLTTHADVLRDCVCRVKARHPFRSDAMVVLPDHLHALWTLPPDDANFAMRWMLIKQGFTKRLGEFGAVDAGRRGRKGERVVWQRRYWEHQIRDDLDLERHVEYIHFNPVKHGFVQRVADWPHSSFHGYVRRGLVKADWGLAADLVGKFGE
jgi:putative transposase